MKKILKSKKGVTLLEGLIALMLLGLVATGTFAVLLSTSRKASQPDIREELTLAVDGAMQMLQTYTSGNSWSSPFDHGLCNDPEENAPTATGTHYVNCLLPPICDRSDTEHNYIKYTIGSALTKPDSKLHSLDKETISGNAYEVTFEAQCNGFSL